MTKRALLYLRQSDSRGDPNSPSIPDQEATLRRPAFDFHHSQPS